jgi:hypothetical protein
MEMTPAEANEDYEDFQEAFAAVFIAAGAPKDARMFRSRTDESKNAFYFSPAAASLFLAVLKDRGAQPCLQLSNDILILLVGNAI